MRNTLRQPDVTFCITVHPISRVYGCAEKRDQESRGLFGFHYYSTCPNCKVVDEGYEMWGENGHCQGRAPSRERLAHWLKYRASQQRIAKGPEYRPGSLIGYRFTLGGRLYYSGGYNHA